MNDPLVSHRHDRSDLRHCDPPAPLPSCRRKNGLVVVPLLPSIRQRLLLLVTVSILWMGSYCGCQGRLIGNSGGVRGSSGGGRSLVGGYTPIDPLELEQPEMINLGRFAVLELLSSNADDVNVDVEEQQPYYSFLPYPEDEDDLDHEVQIIQGSKQIVNGMNYHFTIMILMNTNPTYYDDEQEADEDQDEWICTGAFEVIVYEDLYRKNRSVTEWGKEWTCSDAMSQMIELEEAAEEDELRDQQPQQEMMEPIQVEEVVVVNQEQQNTQTQPEDEIIQEQELSESESESESSLEDSEKLDDSLTNPSETSSSSSSSSSSSLVVGGFTPMDPLELQQPEMNELGMFAVLELVSNAVDVDVDFEELYSFLPYPEEEDDLVHDIQMIQGSKQIVNGINYHFTIMILVNTNPDVEEHQEDDQDEWICTGAFEVTIYEDLSQTKKNRSVTEWGKEWTCSEAMAQMIELEEDEDEDLLLLDQQQEQEKIQEQEPSESESESESSSEDSSESNDSSTTSSEASSSVSHEEDEEQNSDDEEQISSLSSSSLNYPLVGGYSSMTDLELQQPEIKELGLFAVFQLLGEEQSITTNNENDAAAAASASSSSHKKTYAFMTNLKELSQSSSSSSLDAQIVQGSKQVVAGMNYNLTIVLYMMDDDNNNNLEDSSSSGQQQCIGSFQCTVYDHFGDRSVTDWGNEIPCTDAMAMATMMEHHIQGTEEDKVQQLEFEDLSSQEGLDSSSTEEEEEIENGGEDTSSDRITPTSEEEDDDEEEEEESLDVATLARTSSSVGSSQQNGGIVVGSYTPIKDLTQPDLLRVAQLALSLLLDYSQNWNLKDELEATGRKDHYSFLPLFVDSTKEEGEEGEGENKYGEMMTMSLSSSYTPHVIQATQQVVTGMNYNMTMLILHHDVSKPICSGAVELSAYNHFGDLKVTHWGKEISCNDALGFYQKEVIQEEEKEEEFISDVGLEEEEGEHRLL